MCTFGMDVHHSEPERYGTVKPNIIAPSHLSSMPSPFPNLPEFWKDLGRREQRQDDACLSAPLQSRAVHSS